MAVRLPRALAALLAVSTPGCYAGDVATRDVNAAWHHRTRAELEERWGPPRQAVSAGDATLLAWTHERWNVQLPELEAHLRIAPGEVEGRLAYRPGEVWKTTTTLTAQLTPAGLIDHIEGPSLRWGAPQGLNLRWGTILGLHLGMGATGDTPTPLPSGGAYLGGMLSPTLGLVGTFSMVAGTSPDGGALAFGWGLGVQWWPMARLWLRAGPALVLALRPGFAEAHLAPGATGGASLAVVRSGTFVLDLRFDLTVAPSDVFGSVGVGVNLN